MADIIDFFSRLKTKTEGESSRFPEEEAQKPVIIEGAVMYKASLASVLLSVLHKAINENKIHDAFTLLGFVFQQHKNLSVLITERLFNELGDADVDRLLGKAKKR